MKRRKEYTEDSLIKGMRLHNKMVRSGHYEGMDEYRDETIESILEYAIDMLNSKSRTEIQLFRSLKKRQDADLERQGIVDDVLKEIDPVLSQIEEIVDYLSDMVERNKVTIPKELIAPTKNFTSTEDVKKQLRMHVRELQSDFNDLLRSCDDLGIKYDLGLHTDKESGKHNAISIMFK